MQVSPEELSEDWRTKAEFFSGVLPRTSALWVRLWLERGQGLWDRGLDVQLSALRLWADLGGRSLDAAERMLAAVRGGDKALHGTWKR